MGVALMPFYGQADTHNATWYPGDGTSSRANEKTKRGRKDLNVVVVIVVVVGNRCVSNDMPHHAALYFIHKAGWSAITDALDGTVARQKS